MSCGRTQASNCSPVTSPLASGDVTGEQFDAWVRPQDMV